MVASSTSLIYNKIYYCSITNKYRQLWNYSMELWLQLEDRLDASKMNQTDFSLVLYTRRRAQCLHWLDMASIVLSHCQWAALARSTMALLGSCPYNHALPILPIESILSSLYIISLPLPLVLPLVPQSSSEYTLIEQHQPWFSTF